MTIAIVGSRNYPDLGAVRKFVHSLPLSVIVVTGGASGVDSAAEAAARERGIEVRVFRPDWEQFGRSAGIIRNRHIVSVAEMVVVFWDGKSRGTKYTIDLARRLGRRVLVFCPNDEGQKGGSEGT